MTSVSMVEVTSHTGNPIDLVEEIVVANDWAHDRASEEEMIVEISGRWCDYRMYFLWQEELSALHFSCGFDMKVLELQPAKRVLWQVVEGPQEWIGTKISFDLKQSGEHAIVLFKHQGWKEPVEFMHHCSTKWAIYLMSLKSLVETGKGTPNPNDPHISGDGPD